MTIHHFWAVSASKERGRSAVTFFIFLILPLPEGVAVTIIASEELATGRPQRRHVFIMYRWYRHKPLWQDCKPADTSHTRHQTTNTSTMTTPQCVCVCMCVWMHECNPGNHGVLITCVVLTADTDQEHIPAPSPSTPISSLLLLLLLLSVLGKCLSFSEYLCILWHDTEVKLCRALWSCNAVDMGRTPVCRCGLSRSLLNYWTS